jgi:hypothetical protein
MDKRTNIQCERNGDCAGLNSAQSVLKCLIGLHKRKAIIDWSWYPKSAKMGTKEMEIVLSLTAPSLF